MRFLVLILILTGCGADPSKNSTTPTADKTTPATSADPQAAPAVPPASNVDSEGVYAVSLDNVKELPECSPKTNLKQLAYVKADSKFYSCESTGWAELTVTAPKGDKGDAGAKGDVGPAGQAVTLPTNLWLDDVTHLTWLIGGPGGNAGTCTGDYISPTPTAVSTALSHGLGVKFTTTYLFTNVSFAPNGGSGYAEVVEIGTTAERFNVVSNSIATVCLKN